MGTNAKNMMGGGKGPGPGKVAIKKNVTRAGKSFQQTFWVSPQEAMAMQRKAKKEAEGGPKKARGAPELVERANKIFEEEIKDSWQDLGDKLRTPDPKDPKKVLPEPPPFDKHVDIARSIRKKHREAFQKKLAGLKAAAPPNSKVFGRVKTLPSALGKLKRKAHKYKTVEDLQDMSGLTVITGSSDELLDTVTKLRTSFDVVEEDDYISTISDSKSKRAGVMDPGYRAWHMVLRSKEDGLEFEVQLKTKNQATWSKYFHSVYKPTSPEQVAWLRNPENDATIRDYAKRVSRYFEGLDRPDVPETPQVPCTVTVSESPFGCIS